MQQHGGNLLMLHTCSIILCQRRRGSDFFQKKNIYIFCQRSYFIFCQRSYFFAIDNQGNATIWLLQPKILGRNYLSTNNRYNIFIRFITVNSTVHHLCKNLYLKYTNKVCKINRANFTLNSDSICFVDIREVLLTVACMYQIMVEQVFV